MNDSGIYKQKLAQPGRNWKAASLVELDCFRTAADPGADIHQLLGSACIFAKLLQEMTDKQAGAAVL